MELLCSFRPLLLLTLAACVNVADAARPACSARSGSLMQVDFSERSVFDPGDSASAMVAEEEAVALRQRLSQNATVIHSKDASALDEANQQLLLQPLVKQTPSLLVYVAEENAAVSVSKHCAYGYARAIYNYRKRSSFQSKCGKMCRGRARGSALLLPASLAPCAGGNWA